MKKDLQDGLVQTFPPVPEPEGSYEAPRITFEESLEAVAVVCSSPGFKEPGNCSTGLNS